jgi:hypothetical protein
MVCANSLTQQAFLPDRPSTVRMLAACPAPNCIPTRSSPCRRRNGPAIPKRGSTYDEGSPTEGSFGDNGPRFGLERFLWDPCGLHHSRAKNDPQYGTLVQYGARGRTVVSLGRSRFAVAQSYGSSRTFARPSRKKLVTKRSCDQVVHGASAIAMAARWRRQPSQSGGAPSQRRRLIINRRGVPCQNNKRSAKK